MCARVAASEEEAMGLTIGVDVGGTKVAAGVVDEQGRLLATALRPTPSADQRETETVIVDVIRELGVDHAVDAVGIGAAGFVDERRSTVLFAPNLAWRDEPLREAIERATRLPVVVENDANAAAWAEVRFGAGRGENHVVIVTVGTGIGGGIVLDGRLLRGRYGIAAEIGHINLVPNGRRCGCGLEGCWEQYASGRALLSEAQELASVSPAVSGRLLELAGGQPEAITGQMVTEAARAGDVTALRCFDDLGIWLGRGIAQLAAILDPAVFVIAGGVSTAGDLLADPTRRAFLENLTARGHRPHAELRLAELGAEAGIVGAGDLARQP
jgi:glucokinase